MDSLIIQTILSLPLHQFHQLDDFSSENPNIKTYTKMENLGLLKVFPIEDGGILGVMLTPLGSSLHQKLKKEIG